MHGRGRSDRPATALSPQALMNVLRHVLTPALTLVDHLGREDFPSPPVNLTFHVLTERDLDPTRNSPCFGAAAPDDVAARCRPACPDAARPVRPHTAREQIAEVRPSVSSKHSGHRRIRIIRCQALTTAGRYGEQAQQRDRNPPQQSLHLRAEYDTNPPGRHRPVSPFPQSATDRRGPRTRRPASPED
jgi:hypothetical protein